MDTKYYRLVSKVLINDEYLEKVKPKRGCKKPLTRVRQKYEITMNGATCFLNPKTLKLNKIPTGAYCFEKEIAPIFTNIPKYLEWEDGQALYAWEKERSRIILGALGFGEYLSLFELTTTPKKLKKEIILFSKPVIAIYRLVQYLHPRLNTPWKDSHEGVTKCLADYINLNVNDSLTYKPKREPKQYHREIWSRRTKSIKAHNILFLGKNYKKTYPSLSFLLEESIKIVKKTYSDSNKNSAASQFLENEYQALIDMGEAYNKALKGTLFKEAVLTVEDNKFIFKEHRGSKSKGKMCSSEVHILKDSIKGVYLCRNIPSNIDPYKSDVLCL